MGRLLSGWAGVLVAMVAFGSVPSTAGAADSYSVTASADGSRVFFQTAEGLVSSDVDGRNDIYERSAGVTRLISAGQINGNGPFDAGAIGLVRGDGSRVFFYTNEKLVSSDTDASQDIYERYADTTTLISAGEINGFGPFDVFFDGVSDDGSSAFFSTNEKLVSGDTDAQTDIYERSGGTTTLISEGEINGDGPFGADAAGGPSGDGNRFFFRTAEPLGSTDTDGQHDIYERSGGATTLVSAGEINGNGAFAVVPIGVSADGSHLRFRTSEPLVSADTDGSRDLYERSGGTTTLISAGEINGNGAFDVNSEANGASADGNRVFFDTSESLVSSDTDASPDVYERAGGTTTLVSAGEVNGNGAFEAIFTWASTDGARVLFFTDERLVSADTDTTRDVYERFGGMTTLVSAGEINGNGAFSASLSGASADATHAFFQSEEPLTSDDGEYESDVYERSGGTTKLVSAGQINGDGPFVANFNGSSTDGTHAFFHTREPLVAGDTDSFEFDVYERFAGTTRLVSAEGIPPAAFSLNAPADSAQTANPRPPLSWDATTDSGSGLDHYEVLIDGNTVAASISPAATSFTPTSDLTDGTHTWQVKALDALGNTRTSSQRSFLVDTTAPAAFSLNAPADSAQTANPRPPLSWDATTDSGSGLDHYEVLIDGNTVAASISPAATSFTPTSDLTDGTHTWQVKALDALGNTRTSSQRSFLVDTTAPAAPPATPPVTSPVATGKRAAALKACKKKKGKARRKCITKAQKLPV